MTCNHKDSEKTQNIVAKKLLETRTITIFGAITQELSQEVTEKLIVLSETSPDPIKIIINSQGGHVESADTIFDMIGFVKPVVKVIGTGWVASAGALIYSAPDVKNRFCLPNTRFLLHQPSGGVGGQATDISIEANEMLKMKDRLNRIFSRQTGQTIDQIEDDTDRNFWMSAEEAQKYGLVGKIITSMDKL
ncbi:MAG: ATP-dependent Clp protease proteolytic subunit [Desulfobacteraceae bacterium]|nr:ATP-dependent Clp protease proteolytic subunit [Desulfobacteraceae bacterium]